LGRFNGGPEDDSKESKHVAPNNRM
jgi:hypothetical protein